MAGNATSDSSGYVQKFFSGVKALLGTWWWVFPVIVAGAAYFVPALNHPVNVWPLPTNLPWWLLAEFVFCVAWLVSGFFNASNANTSVAALKADALISNLISHGLLAMSVFLLAKNSLVWGVIIPTLTALADAHITPDRAINNAAQKPLMTQQSERK